MSDQELRELERTVARDGSSGTRLALANALERAGRIDDAWDVLRPARRDPEVRARLADAPAWTHAQGDEGRTRFLDVPAAAREPRVLWTRRIDATTTYSLLASPLAVVVLGSDGTHGVIAALDPETGETLWTDRDESARHAIVRDVLVRCGDTIATRDLVTGERLVQLPPRGINEPAVAPGIIVFDERRRAGPITALRWDDPRREPEPLWELSAPPLVWSNVKYSARVSRDHVFVPDETDPHGTIVLRRSDGAEAFRTASERLEPCDARGFIGMTYLPGTRWGGGSLIEDGRRRWRLAHGLAPAILGGTYVALRVGDDRVAILDRADGRPRAEFAKGGEPWSPTSIGVRDAIYTGSTFGVACTSLDGATLWQCPFDRPTALAPASRRLFVLGHDGTVTCFDEERSAS